MSYRIKKVSNLLLLPLPLLHWWSFWVYGFRDGCAKLSKLIYVICCNLIVNVCLIMCGISYVNWDAILSCDFLLIYLKVMNMLMNGCLISEWLCNICVIWCFNYCIINVCWVLSFWLFIESKSELGSVQMGKNLA